MSASFLIGVPTTGVVCRPGCPGRPHARNVVLLAGLAEARRAGLRPCLRCRPDVMQAPPGAPIRLGTRRPFAEQALLAFLADRAIPGVEAVEGRQYRRRLRLAHGVADVRLDLRDDGVDAVLEADPRDAGALVARVRALLDLDADAPAIDAALRSGHGLAPLVAARPGLRAPGALEPDEVLARAIVGQQISVAAARTVLGRLAARHGTDGCFPAAATLAELDPATLPMPRARARALTGAMAAVAVDPALIHDGDGLQRLPGLGPWTAAYVALRLGDADAFPATDLVARRAMRALGIEPEHAERWRPLRGYALHHLWLSQSRPRAVPPCAPRSPRNASPTTNHSKPVTACVPVSHISA
jgi:AraC family transcriptional regulator of adaptative response / DNA-3-methyladenine glycosylase II